jgi:hypothetical protein
MKNRLIYSYIWLSSLLLFSSELIDIDFNFADATIKQIDPLTHSETLIEAFRVIRPGRGQPNQTWVSVGAPTPLLIPSLDPNQTNKSVIFFTSTGFYVQINMLTRTYKEQLAKRLTNSYSDIKPEQILDLKLTKFECKSGIYVNSTWIDLTGQVTDFNSYPLRLNFSLNDLDREFFKDFFAKNNNDELILKCELTAGNNMYVKRLMALSIKPLLDFFGHDDFALVLRSQLEEMAEQLYDPVEDESEFELSLDRFKSLFMQKVINLAATDQSGFEWYEIMLNLPYISDMSGYESQNFAAVLESLCELFVVQESKSGRKIVTVNRKLVKQEPNLMRLFSLESIIDTPKDSGLSVKEQVAKLNVAELEWVLRENWRIEPVAVRLARLDLWKLRRIGLIILHQTSRNSPTFKREITLKQVFDYREASRIQSKYSYRKNYLILTSENLTESKSRFLMVILFQILLFCRNTLPFNICQRRGFVSGEIRV